ILGRQDDILGETTATAARHGGPDLKAGHARSEGIHRAAPLVAPHKRRRCRSWEQPVRIGHLGHAEPASVQLGPDLARPPRLDRALLYLLVRTTRPHEL